MTVRSFEQHTPLVHPDAFVDETALLIGDVTLGANSSVWPMSVIRGDVNTITIGARSNIQDAAVLHVTHDSEYAPGGFPLQIGDDVTIGHAAVIHACTLEDECLIGMRATVLDGAVIEKHTIVAAGSVVPAGKVLEGGFLYMGSPARKIRPLNDKQLAYFRYIARTYVDLAQRHRASPT